MRKSAGFAQGLTLDTEGRPLSGVRIRVAGVDRDIVSRCSTVQYSTVHCTGALPAQDPAVPHTEAAAGPGPEEGPAEDTDTVPGVAQETATATVLAILILF